MAKKDKKAKSAKALDVKLPKELRKVGGKLVEAANSPAGRQLIAAGLSLAAAAAAAAVQKDNTKPQPASDDAKSPPPAANNGNDPHDIGVALGKMAEAALAGLFKPKG